MQFESLKGAGVPNTIVEALTRYYPHKSKSARRLHDLLPTRTRPWFYLWGPVGTGKSTYGAYLLALFLRERMYMGDRELTTEERYLYRFIRVSELFHRMKEDFGKSSQTREGMQLFDSCLSARFLVLDDLTSTTSPWEAQMLDLLIDKRYGDMTYTVITSNHSLPRLAQVLGSERISSRIGASSRLRQMKTPQR